MKYKYTITYSNMSGTIAFAWVIELCDQVCSD